MRVFIIIRCLFFALIISSISLFIFHSKLCVNFEPHQLETIAINCQHELKSTILFEGLPPKKSRKPRSIEMSNEKILVRTKEVGEIGIAQVKSNLTNTTTTTTTTSISTTTTLAPAANLTTSQKPQVLTTTSSNSTNITTTTTSTPNITTTTANPVVLTKKKERKNGASEWHRIEFEGQKIKISTRSCFEYDFKYILTTDSSYISKIISPLRLLLILIITSLLLSLLDISLRYVLNTTSLIQTLVHNAIQLLLWCLILIYTEVFRRSWQQNWHEHSPLEYAPMYPPQWLFFEAIAFLVVMLIVVDTISFNYSNYLLRFENSQGVYRIIEEEENKTKKYEEDDEYLNSTVSTVM